MKKLRGSLRRDRQRQHSHLHFVRSANLVFKNLVLHSFLLKKTKRFRVIVVTETMYVKALWEKYQMLYD